jgi:hypothetical protein
MVWEAFFSSLTHMSCLTFLRSYLHRNPGERLWRLFGMLSIAGLLFTAMLPTYNFNISRVFLNPPEFLPRPADQTICYFRPGHMSHGHRGGERTVASLAILFLGFSFRTIRLFKLLSTGFLAKFGYSTNKFLVRKLEAIYTWCDVQHSPHSLKRTLLYWPILAIFWTGTVGWDFVTSMYFEVGLTILSNVRPQSFKHGVASIDAPSSLKRCFISIRLCSNRLTFERYCSWHSVSVGL